MAGINSNYGDSAKFEGVTYSGGHACQKFIANNNGKEPSNDGNYIDKTGSWTCK